MKITITFLMLLVLFLPYTPAQEYTRWNLPEGAVARLGKGSINGIQYSPDGAHLAVATSIGIWLCDTTTYQEVALLAGHTGSVTSIAFSPNGGTLASGSRDKTVRLWNAETGALKQTLAGHKGAVNSIAFSPDGRVFVSGDVDRTVRLWDAVTLEPKRTLSGHTGSVESLAFSPDGKMLVSGSWDGTILVWKVH